jgi:hypothetical protein
MVGAVCHHDRDRVALELVETGTDGESEPRRVVGPVVTDPLVRTDELADHLCGAIGARVVDHDKLVVDVVRLQDRRKCQQRRSDRLLLVVGGDDDGELQTATLQRSTF